MKVSFAVAALLGSVSAQPEPKYTTVQAIGPVPMNTTDEARMVDQEMSRDARQITRAIDDLQRQIPPTDVSGKISYSVNTAPIKSGLDLQKEFYQTDFKKFENAVQEVMGTPLQNAKLQIATQFAGVAGSTLDTLQAQMRTMPDGEKCQARPFYDCLQTMQRWERRGPRIFSTKCAQDSGCGFPETNGTQWEELQGKMNATQQKWGMLAQSVAGEFEEVANKQGQIIDGVGNKWMNKSADWMKSDMKCDAGCVDNYMQYRSWTDYNEFDLMMRCPCEIPIKVAPVQDFEGKDFFKMTAADHLTILADAAAGDAAAAGGDSTESAKDKAKRIAKETAAKAKKAGQEGVDKLNEASGGNAMYIIGGVAVLCLGGVAYYFCSKKDEEEGGQDDRFSTLL